VFNTSQLEGQGDIGARIEAYQVHGAKAYQVHGTKAHKRACVIAQHDYDFQQDKGRVIMEIHVSCGESIVLIDVEQKPRTVDGAGRTRGPWGVLAGNAEDLYDGDLLNGIHKNNNDI
jgi:hypothetical protein